MWGSVFVGVYSGGGPDEGREGDSRACFADAAMTVSEESWSGWFDGAILDRC